MDILIKGMEKPRCCGDCRFFKRGHNPFGEDFIFAQPWGDCLVSGEKDVIEHEISEGCPLVALPEHGRLVDLDKLAEEFDGHGVFMEEEVKKIIDFFPVVVEANNGNNN